MIIIIGKKREGMISMFLALPTKTTLICKIVIILGMLKRQQSKTNRDNTKKRKARQMKKKKKLIEDATKEVSSQILLIKKNLTKTRQQSKNLEGNQSKKNQLVDTHKN